MKNTTREERITNHTTTSVLGLLRGGRLLRPHELHELDSIAAHYQTPSGLLRAVLKRGWLSAYQAQELLAGRGRGLLIGEFVVLEPLGVGSTARVFKARPWSGERIVGLKVLGGKPVETAAVERLRREAWAGARLNHPNILRTCGSGRDGATHFLITEYAAGKSLGRLLRGHGALPVSRACDYVRQASLALEHAQGRGLVHRDVKPSNLFLTAGTNVVKLLDFGLACQAGERVVPAGTPDYVAPEQAASDGADSRSDIYALGCTLYHLLTGSPPFPGGSAKEKVRRHQREEPRAVEELRPELPVALAEVLRKMMRKYPAERFPTAVAAARSLAPFAEPGDCEASYVLELGEQGLADLDPGQATTVLLP